MKTRKRSTNLKNLNFIDTAILNDATFMDYLNRFTNICLSLFEWVNLPPSMNARFLELSLFEFGSASLLYDENYGFINTKCATNGPLNIYGLPSSLNCYSFEYQSNRKLYTGLKNNPKNDDECILVMNNWQKIPTLPTMQLFALRLYNAERTADVNIIAQKTPVLVVVDEKQRNTMENVYSQFEGNKPAIFGDKNQLGDNVLRVIKTDAPFIADKIMEYKKEIWNEALTFLGINNILVDKKERLITEEASSNNELINLNLQNFLAPRQEACREFNEKFGFTGTEKEISVRVRSDLHNIIKNSLSVVSDYQKDLNNDILSEIKKEV